MEPRLPVNYDQGRGVSACGCRPLEYPPHATTRASFFPGAGPRAETRGVVRASSIHACHRWEL
jgi:hypothetical protein